MATPLRQEYCKNYYRKNREHIKAKSAKWRINNPEKAAKAIKKWIAAHPTRRQEISHRSRLKTKYKLTPEAYQKMLDIQFGACAICKQAETNTSGNTKFLCVDHCHTTGKIRGLLCKSCNIAIGSVKESQERLLAAAAYLKERS